MSGITACLLGSLMFVGTRSRRKRGRPDGPRLHGHHGFRCALTIESTEPGKPAAKAGLQTGDLIVRVGTLEPRDFEQVVAHICSFRPGAVVEIEVQRGSDAERSK